VVDDSVRADSRRGILAPRHIHPHAFIEKVVLGYSPN
jgi:hypothetical protein